MIGYTDSRLVQFVEEGQPEQAEHRNTTRETMNNTHRKSAKSCIENHQANWNINHYHI